MKLINLGFEKNSTYYFLKTVDKCEKFVYIIHMNIYSGVK
jgi:hypothetical protein